MKAVEYINYSKLEEEKREKLKKKQIARWQTYTKMYQ